MSDPNAATTAARKRHVAAPLGLSNRYHVPQVHFEAILDRLEHAVRIGLLPMNLEFYQRILHALFPEHFALELPLDCRPTQTHPFTDERLGVWGSRAKRRRHLTHPNDAPITALASVRPPRRKNASPGSH